MAQTKVDMSPRAITKRLETQSQLHDLIVVLGKAVDLGPVEKPRRILKRKKTKPALAASSARHRAR